MVNKILLFFTSTVAKLEQKFKNENLCQKQQLDILLNKASHQYSCPVNFSFVNFATIWPPQALNQTSTYIAQLPPTRWKSSYGSVLLFLNILAIFKEHSDITIEKQYWLKKKIIFKWVWTTERKIWTIIHCAMTAFKLENFHCSQWREHEPLG